jgi:hypothetical protein
MQSQSCVRGRDECASLARREASPRIKFAPRTDDARDKRARKPHAARVRLARAARRALHRGERIHRAALE